MLQPVIETRFVFGLGERPVLKSVDGDLELLTGYPPVAFHTGRVTLAERIHPHDRDLSDRLFAPGITSSPQFTNLRIRRADGRIVCVRAAYQKSGGEDGAFGELELRLQDARSLPRTMEDATTSSQLVAMMENTDDYIYFKDRNHVFTGASGTLVNLCHPAQHWRDLLGKTDYDVFAEEYADIYYSLEKRVFSGEQVAHEVQRTLSKEGGRHGWVDNRKYPIRNAAGEVIGLYGIARDITHETWLEQERDRLLAGLAASDNEIYVFDAETLQFDFANRGALENLGYSLRELRAMTPLDVKPQLTPTAFEALIAPLRRHAQSSVQFETVHRRKNGQDYDVSVFLQLFEPAGDRPYFLAMISDVTERKASEQALIRAKAAAEAANIAKSTFLANMSHEIRTPMNAILGMAHLMRREGATPGQAERLDKIDASGRHLLGIINDILDLSKIEAGKLALEEAPIDIGRIVATVLQMAAMQAEAKGLKLAFDVPPLPVALLGDPTRFQQALLNYVTNAIKFTEAGSVTVRIRVADESGERIVLRCEVADTGIGIASDRLDRLFQSFEQADSSTTRKYGGTGLGLVITSRLAELMGGTAGVESSLGRGSTFWFTVALRKGDLAAATDLPPAELAEVVLRRDHAGSRVLLAEDDPINQEVARELLEDCGLVVDVAGNGLEAVERVRSGDYALVLMDMQMPGLGGVAAAQEIRKLDVRQMPIVALTANAQADDRATCLAAGMNDFFTKPFDPERLFDAVLKWLEPGTR